VCLDATELPDEQTSHQAATTHGNIEAKRGKQQKMDKKAGRGSRGAVGVERGRTSERKRCRTGQREERQRQTSERGRRVREADE